MPFLGPYRNKFQTFCNLLSNLKYLVRKYFGFFVFSDSDSERRRRETRPEAKGERSEPFAGGEILRAPKARAKSSLCANSIFSVLDETVNHAIGTAS